MTWRVWQRFPGLVAGLLGLALVGCGQGAEGERGWRDDGRLRVLATTTMIEDLARQLAGDMAQVKGLMRPGEDPHIYEVRPQDARLVAGADVILLNGLHLEGTLQGVVRNTARRDAQAVALAEDPRIRPLGGAQAAGAADPHCWFNVAHFRVYAERARDALAAADAKNAAHYQAAAARYLRELDELDRWVRAELGSIPRPRRVIVTSHDAFGYFGQAYDVEVHAVIGISTEQQPRPQDLKRLEQLVRERGVRALFIETSVSKTLNDIVRRVARDTGAQIGGSLYSDSLGAPGSGAETYVAMVRHNVRTIAEALR